MRDFFQVRGWRRFFLAFSIITLSAILLTNCNSGLEPVGQIAGPGIRVESDPVNYLVEDPILQARYSCTGKLLKYPKYLGSESREVFVPGRVKQVPDSILNQAGYFFIGTSAGSKASSFVPLNPNLDKENLVSENKKSSGSGFGYLWDVGKLILVFLLGLIGFVLALILTAWIIKKLIELAKKLFTSSPSNPETGPVQENSSQISIANLSDEERSSLVTEAKTSVMKELESDSDFVSLDDRLYYKHVEEMTKILQQTGGKVDCVIGNCTYMIEIHEQKNKEKS